MRNFLYLFSKSLLDVLPLALVLTVFTKFVIKEPIGNQSDILFGFFLVVIGIFFFMRGLDISLFPFGETMAFSFAQRGRILEILGFAAAIGYATTIAEPALIAVCNQAEKITSGGISAFILRNVVAIGVATGLTIGTLRIILGHPIQYYIGIGYIMVMILTNFVPNEIIGIAYDSGAVTTSTVTVPLVTALGIGLSKSIEGRNPLVDGFGLVAFASLAPIISVMVYGILSL